MGIDRVPGASATSLALDMPITRAVLGRYRVRAVVGLVGGGAFVIATVGLLVASPSVGLPVYSLGLAIAFLAAGVVALVDARRMRNLFARHPWVGWPYRFAAPDAWRGYPVVVLTAPDGTVYRLNVKVAKWKVDAVVRALEPERQPLWFCGDPARAVALCPDDGSFLAWATRRRKAPKAGGHRLL